MNRQHSILVLAIAAFLLCAVFPVAAANDPGHDSLYVLRVGDTNVTGSINLSGNFVAGTVQWATLLYGTQLDIRANGTILTPGSRPAIQSDANELYLDAITNLRLNTRAGTTGVVQIGPTTGSSVTLNVSGTIRQQNVAVCLSNGTNCINGNNTGNVSTVTAGSGISNSGTASDPVLDVNAGDGITITADQVIINNASVCRTDGTGCPGGAVSGSGWKNSSTLVDLVTNTTNVSIGNATGNLPALYIDARFGRTGFGTPRPTQLVDINGTVNVSTGNLHIQTGVLIIAGTTTISNARVGTFGSGTTINGQNVCLADGTNCLTGTPGSGWLNTTTQVYLANNATNVTVGRDASSNPILFVDNTNGRVGIGTASPTRPLMLYGDSNGSAGTTSAPISIVLHDTGNTNTWNITHPYESLDFSSSDTGGGGVGVRSRIGVVMDSSIGRGQRMGFYTSEPTTTDPIERMSIGSSGNVGIGVVSATAALQVNSSLPGGSFFVHNTTGSSHVFVNGNTGLVGIGTIAPTARLHVNASANDTYAFSVSAPESTTGASIDMMAGNASGVNDDYVAGSIFLRSGSGGDSGGTSGSQAGNITIFSGRGGDGVGLGVGGRAGMINITTGRGGDGNTHQPGGPIYIAAGAGGDATLGVGGTVTISGGMGGTGGGNGGSINLTPGGGATSGNVYVSAGNLLINNTVGIGTTTPGAALEVNAQSENAYVLYTAGSVRYTGTGTPQQAVYNLHTMTTNVTAARGYAGYYALGLYNSSPTLTIADVQGYSFGAQLGSSITTRNTTGMTVSRYSHIFVRPDVGNTFNATVTSFRTLDLAPVNWAGGGANGTIASSIALYIRDQTAVNGSSYAIYSIGTDDLNVFAGNTTIGSTTAYNQQLTVVGNTNVSQNLYLGTSGISLETRWTNRTVNNQTVTGTTLANINELAWLAEANKNYTFDCSIYYRSNTTTNGISFAIEDTGGTVTRVKMGATMETVTATTVNSGVVLAVATKVTSTGVTAVNVAYQAFLTGTVINGATALTINPQFSAEVANHNSTVIQDSWCQVTELRI